MQWLKIIQLELENYSIGIEIGKNQLELKLENYSIGMSTGCGKSPLYKYLLSILQKTKKQCGLSEEATFEKIGAMAENYSKLLGLYIGVGIGGAMAPTF